MKFKKLYALYKENEVLIRIGAYTKGVDKELDEAVSKIENMKNLLLILKKIYQKYITVLLKHMKIK
jgi:flagellar biosynthesis/type III secretory pathway ATPase